MSLKPEVPPWLVGICIAVYREGYIAIIRKYSYF